MEKNKRVCFMEKKFHRVEICSNAKFFFFFFCDFFFGGKARKRLEFELWKLGRSEVDADVGEGEIRGGCVDHDHCQHSISDAAFKAQMKMETPTSQLALQLVLKNLVPHFYNYIAIYRFYCLKSRYYIYIYKQWEMIVLKFLGVLFSFFILGMEFFASQYCKLHQL
ncbi:hypothetical protein ACOSQ2_017356 [Xanthoceras sorbifolium]